MWKNRPVKNTDPFGFTWSKRQIELNPDDCWTRIQYHLVLSPNCTRPAWYRSGVFDEKKSTPRLSIRNNNSYFVSYHHIMHLLTQDSVMWSVLGLTPCLFPALYCTARERLPPITTTDYGTNLAGYTRPAARSGAQPCVFFGLKTQPLKYPSSLQVHPPSLRLCLRVCDGCRGRASRFLTT